MALDQRRVDAEQVRLRLVRVGDHAAGDVVRGARELASGGPPAARRARLGEPDRRRPRSSSATCSSIVVPSVAEEEARRGARRTRRAPHRAAASAPVAVADVDLELAAAQAGRDLERRQIGLAARSRAASWRSPTRGCRTAAACSPETASRAVEHRADGLRRPSARRPHRLQLARRPGQDDHRGPVGRGPPGRARSPPGRSSAAPRGTIACLRLASRSASGSKRSRRAKPARIPAIFSSISSSRTSSRPAKRATTSAVRSSAVGPSPPLVTIRSTPSAARNSSAASRSRGAVADAEDVGDVDAELAEPLRDPRAVAVA